MDRIKKSRHIKKVCIGVLSVILLIAASYQTIFEFFKTPPAFNENVSVHFIDVGQGDSILLRAFGENILIDAGDEAHGGKVVQYLKKYKISKLNLLIGTHPHEDHIGGINKILQNISVDKILFPKLSEELMPTSKFYRQLITEISEMNIPFYTAAPQMTFSFGEAVLEILGPIPEYHTLNNASIVSKFSYQGVSFLMTGDMEKEEEQKLLDAHTDLKSTVLKLGHHGSSTSSTKQFLEAVMPQCYVISVGKDNPYALPSKQTLKHLQKELPVYRTDLNGSIVFWINHGALKVALEKKSNGDTDVDF